jgi:uncharacterized membrane protein YccC
VTIVGVIVAWIVTWLIWPVKRDRNLHPHLFFIIRNLPLVLSANDKLKLKHFTNLLQVLDYAKAALPSKRCYKNYVHFSIALKTQFNKLKDLQRDLNALQGKEIFSQHQEELTNLKICLQELLQQQERSLKKGLDRQCLEGLDLAELEEKINSFEEKIIAIRQQGGFKQFVLKEVFLLFSTIAAFRGAVRDIKHVQQTLSRLVNREESAELEKIAAEQEDNSLLPINTHAMKKSIKLTLAVLIMLFLHYYFGWYSGIQAVITVTVILAQPNFGRSEHRSLLRLLGVLIGGIVGLLMMMVLAQFTHFYMLAIFLFFGIFIADYIALDGEKWGYAGLQAAVMLPLILMISNEPATSMALPLHRFFGVLEGMLIAITIALLIWPENPVKQLKMKIASALRLYLKGFSTLINERGKLSKQLKRELEKTVQSHEGLLYDAEQVLGRESNSREFISLVTSINQLYSNLLLIDRALAVEENSRLSLIALNKINDFLAEVQNCICNLFNSFEAEAYQCSKAEYLSVELFSRLESLRKEGFSKDASLHELQNFATTMAALNRILHGLQSIDKVSQQLNLCAVKAQVFKEMEAKA